MEKLMGSLNKPKNLKKLPEFWANWLRMVIEILPNVVNEIFSSMQKRLKRIELKL